MSEGTSTRDVGNALEYPAISTRHEDANPSPPERDDSPAASPGQATPRAQQESSWIKAYRTLKNESIIRTTIPASFFEARRLRHNHWRPLRLRLEGLVPDRGAKASVTTSPSLRLSSRGSRSGLDAQSTPVRLLKPSDEHVRIPRELGKWLVEEQNLAPDPENRRKPQVLYVAKVSVRWKDHIISEAPCAYAIACPFPFMICSYLYSLWKVYTCQGCPDGVVAFDQPALWYRKQYHLRTYVHVYNNRIEANYPTVRFPWGLLGCGSWNKDNVLVHYFDRGAFGFRQVPCATRHHCFCICEPFGQVAGRQRCPCNGPLIDSRCRVHCNQWCCDHWLCSVCCCHFHYPGLQDAAEFAAAADVALQAYFDGHHLEQDEFDRRLDAELELRNLPKRKVEPDSGKWYPVDNHSYAYSSAIIPVALGVLTVAMQIFMAIAGALYIQWSTHREWYESYWRTVSEPDNYGRVIKNATRVVEAMIPGGDDTNLDLR